MTGISPSIVIKADPNLSSQSPAYCELFVPGLISLAQALVVRHHQTKSFSSKHREFGHDNLTLAMTTKASTTGWAGWPVAGRICSGGVLSWRCVSEPFHQPYTSHTEKKLTKPSQAGCQGVMLRLASSPQAISGQCAAQPQEPRNLCLPQYGYPGPHSITTPLG
jgi:hypothetical protein